MSKTTIGPLHALVTETLSAPQPAPVHAAAAHAAARFGEGVTGVLFHGSARRANDLEGLILDFYLLVDSYDDALDQGWLARATRLLPPSVFYDESDARGTRLHAKVNLISLADFARMAAGGGPGVTVWARFAQPSALVSCRDAASRAAIETAVADAIRTMLREALPLCDTGADARTVWRTALSLTYGAELRAELPGKADELYDADRAYYERAFLAAMVELGVALEGSDDPATARLAAAPHPGARRRARWRWRRRRVAGKLLSLLRLIKGAFTFDGGMDYLAWKIARHSGVRVEPSPWQRRHPILGGLWLFLRLRRRGAFR